MARILVADDNQSVLEIIRDTLEQFGFEVVPVMTGEDALRVALSDAIDLAVIDIIMKPGIDGYEVLRAIRAANLSRRLPVILMSALDGPKDRERAMKEGADAFCLKPMSITEMLPVIESLLSDAPPAP